MREPWEPNNEACEKAYAFIKEHIRVMGYAPTHADITDGMGFKARSTAHRLIRGLEDRGWIARSQDRRRIIRLTRGESNGQG